MVEASCFQASRVGVEGTAARLGVGPSREDTVAVVTGGAGGDEGAKEGLVSAAEAENEASALPFAAPPSVRKWKLQEAEWGVSGGQQRGPRAGQPFPVGQAWAWWVLPVCLRSLGAQRPPGLNAGSWLSPNYAFLQ